MKRTGIVVVLLLLFSAFAVFPEPCTKLNPGLDLLSSVPLTAAPINAKDLMRYRHFRFSVSGQQHPEHWKMVLSGNPDLAEGSLFCDGRTIRIIQRKNLWNGNYLTMKTPIPAKKLHSGEHAAGFWAKGKGTLTLELEEFCGKQKKTVQKFRYLITDQWQYYQTKSLTLRNKNTDFFKLNIGVYGDVSFSKPEMVPQSAVDFSAEMVFYVPFDHGRADALFSRGGSGVFGISEPVGYVKGIAGDALRIDSKRRITPWGMLRLPMGLQYTHPGEALPTDRGTLEFWFKPHPELHSGKKWEPFPLFSIGTHTWMWPDSEDFVLRFNRINGTLGLEYKEHIRLQQWPGKTPVKIAGNPLSERKIRRNIDRKNDFINRWHHLAFTWEPKCRRVYLDGKKVLEVAADKTPCISAPDPSLYLGCIALNQPFTASCDFDELKIFKGVRYRDDFTPQVRVPEFKRTAEKARPVIPPDPDAVCFDWNYNKTTYQLQVKLLDGAPVIYSSYDAAGTVRTPHAPEPEVLPFKEIKRTPDSRTVLFPKRNVQMSCRIQPVQDTLQLSVTLKKEPGASERVWLEPRILLVNPAEQWHTAFDGFSSRPLLFPFRPFAYRNLQTALPVAGAWNEKSAVALAMTPGTLVSYLSRGMDSPRTLSLKLRTVLDDHDSVTWNFEVFPFSPAYGAAALVDRYHAAHPEFFAFSNIDPRLYGNIAQSNIWNSAAYRKRKKLFSLPEITRRIRGSWCWYYWTGAATGNWSVDPELLKEFAPLNESRVGDDFYHNPFRRGIRKELQQLLDSGVAPSLYISTWAEKRLVPAFRDSLIESEEIPNGIFYWKNYWTRGVTDYIMLPSGVRYGTFLRRQIQNMIRQYPECSSFSHDLFGGDYFFRKNTTLAGLRAWDEKGVYAHNLPAMGKFVDDIKAMKRSGTYRTALISNGHVQNGSFNTFFRTDNNIHERPLTWALQDWGNLQQHTRFMGEKPTTFFNMPSVLGNYIHADKDDIELIRYALIQQQQSQLLLGMLFNINQNWSVLGVRESIPMLDELLQTHALGHRQVPAFSGSEALAKVRYGDARSGALVLINFSFENRNSNVEPDHGYLGGVPLLCAENRMLQVRNSRVANVSVPPLSWQIIQMAARADSEKLSYDANMTRIRAGRKMSFVFRDTARIKRLEFRLNKEEQLRFVKHNGKSVAVKANGADFITGPVILKAGDRLDIETCDKRWQMPVERLGTMSFRKGTILAPGNLKSCGARIQEFFRFWGVNQTPEQVFDLQVTEKEDQNLLIELKTAPVQGIFQTGSRIVIAGKNLRAVMDMTGEFLAALEKYYPYAGFFGNQMPVYDWDHATTGEQRKLLKRSGLIRETLSSREISEKFRNWVKTKNIRAGQGF